MESKAVDVEIQGEEEWEQKKYYVIRRTTGRQTRTEEGVLLSYIKTQEICSIYNSLFLANSNTASESTEEAIFNRCAGFLVEKRQSDVSLPHKNVIFSSHTTTQQCVKTFLSLASVD